MNVSRVSIPWPVTNPADQSNASWSVQPVHEFSGNIRCLLVPFDLSDTWQRAEHSVGIAERRVQDIRSMVDEATSADSVISTVIQAMDNMKGIVDTMADVSVNLLDWRSKCLKTC